jgi:hypothetical protein
VDRSAAVGGIHQRRGDPHFITLPLHRAFQEVRDAQQLADLGARILRVAELERRVAADDLQARELRERVDQVFRQAVGEELLALLAFVGERQHRDGFFRDGGGTMAGADVPTATPDDRAVLGAAAAAFASAGAGAWRSTATANPSVRPPASARR